MVCFRVLFEARRITCWSCCGCGIPGDRSLGVKTLTNATMQYLGTRRSITADTMAIV